VVFDGLLLSRIGIDVSSWEAPEEVFPLTEVHRDLFCLKFEVVSFEPNLVCMDFALLWCLWSRSLSDAKYRIGIGFDG
jgi:hypothetical protein